MTNDNEVETETEIEIKPSNGNGNGKKINNISLKREYKTVNFKITPQTINDFELMANRRQISSGHVGKIHAAFIAGKNPVGVLIVNFREGKYRLIDGNHRIEAVKRFYARKGKNYRIEIECTMKVYENLTDAEEMEIYTNEAKRRNESFEDRLSLYKNTITFWKLLNDPLERFPCEVSIYPSTYGLKFKTILTAMYTIRNSEEDYSSLNVPKEDAIRFANSLQYEDFVFLKEFVTFFQKIYGKVEKTNIYLTSNFFMPLIDIYYKNRQYKDEPGFEKRFANVIGRSTILTLLNTHGREYKLKLREEMLQYMNHGVSVKVFV